MATVYVENPYNFDDIARYVLIEKDTILTEILAAERMYFYDACAFRKHARMPNPQWLFQFVKKSRGIVLITRCILMELASQDGRLRSEYIAFFAKMHLDGLKVLILYEEDVGDVLEMCFSSNRKINRCLAYAVKTVKSPVSTIETTLKKDDALLHDVLVKENTNGELFRRFFGAVRKNKEQGDSLGEEMIALCVHLLSNLPNTTEYQYLIFTEDKGAVGLMNKASKNVYEHRGVRSFSVLTTPKLAQCFYEEGIVTDKLQVEEVLSINNVERVVKFLGSARYDLERKEKTMSCSELADGIVTPGAIHIYY